MRLSAKKGARSLPKPPSPTGNPGNPDFLPRSAGENRVCAFPQRKVHEVCQSHQVPQEIRGTRLSCHTALERTAYAPFRKERCTKFAKATKSHRKSGKPGLSCHAALERTAYAPFRKERRMMFTGATKFHRKSGGA